MGSGAPSNWTASEPPASMEPHPDRWTFYKAHPATHSWGISVIRSGEFPVIARRVPHQARDGAVGPLVGHLQGLRGQRVRPRPGRLSARCAPTIQWIVAATGLRYPELSRTGV